MMIRALTQSCRRLMGVALLAGSTALQAAVVPLDSVVAVVDNDVIMASELQQRTQMIVNQLRSKQQTNLPPAEVLQQQILEQLIVESLQLQMARRAGIAISEAELDDAINRMQEANQLSRAQLLQRLQADGMTIEALRDQIRRDMLIERVQRGSVNRRIQVSDQEVNNFLRSKQGQFWSSPSYNLGHILVAVPAGASVSEVAAAEARANQLYQQLQGGADFRQAAIRESRGQNALSGGDMGWRKSSEMPDLFASALEPLRPGQVSKPLRSAAGFHLLKLYDKKGAEEKIVEQSLVRHILIKPSAILSEEETERKLADLRNQVINGADFGELARQYSEDVGSKLSGGDLGWSLPGKFVPEFEKTIDATPVGEVSPPFRSQFGWHILQVQDRRQQDMSDTVRRNQASMLLRNQRYEEELFNWLREIRDEAYVEIKLPQP